MPRVSIYVPDQMKDRIDLIGRRVNWSGVAQIAFEAEIERMERFLERDWLFVSGSAHGEQDDPIRVSGR